MARSYSLVHLADGILLSNLAALVARDRGTTAELLAHIAEVDTRRLYVPEGFPSMFLYCVHQLRLSEDSAYKRIQAARTARQFPHIFDALADGRLHLTAVKLLGPYLTPGTPGSGSPQDDPRGRAVARGALSALGNAGPGRDPSALTTPSPRPAFAGAGGDVRV